jgi:hypothetical protein
MTGDPFREFDIRPWVLGVSVFLAALMCCSQAAAQEPFVLPCGVPYECATDIRVANAKATWRMTFDRRWPAVYDIVHWELSYHDGRRAEYLAQLVRPAGERMRYRFFVRERRGVWWTLGIRKRLVWRPVNHGSPEQNLMIARVQQLYSVANALRFEADPRSLRF